MFEEFERHNLEPEEDKTEGGKWLKEGSVIDGRYKILKLVKAGGMGAVYKAADLLMDNKVIALKQMLDTFSDPQERRDSIDRFVSEIQILSSICHPNIPHVSDNFVLGNSFFFVMDFIDGRDLSNILKSEGNPGLPEATVAKIGIEVCEALKYIHNMDVPFAHSDIKPSNIIVRNSDSRVMLIDFGIARVVSFTEGFWIGTPGYAPPEQQRSQPEPRSDFYALGATMHELLTGHRPVDFDFPHFSEFGVKVSQGMEDILVEALAFDPEERIQTAEDFQQKLIALLGYNPVAGIGEGFKFTEAVVRYKNDVLDPMLNELITRYGNECNTRFIPKNIDYFAFSLACPMPFELIIRKNDDKERIEFFTKEGILSPSPIGSINPMSDGPDAAKKIIRSFTNAYDIFKSGAWGLM